MMVAVMVLSQIRGLSISFNSIIQFLTQMSAIAWIGTFFLVWLIIWLPIAIPLLIRLKWHPFEPFTPAQKLSLLASLYPIAPLLLWAFALFKQQSFEHFGLSWQPGFFLSGLLGIGIALIGLTILFGIQLKQGWIHWQLTSEQAFWNTIPLSFLIGIWVSATEELVFRGFLLNQLLTVFSSWQAAIASSVIFAFLHLVWDREETIPQLPGLWLMGMVLVIARWANQDWLGLAIGLHAGWVGGMISLDTSQVLKFSEHAPIWFTGIDHKPLAGWGGILLLFLTGCIVWVIWAF